MGFKVFLLPLTTSKLLSSLTCSGLTQAVKKWLVPSNLLSPWERRGHGFVL